MSDCSICGKRHPNPSENPCLRKQDNEILKKIRKIQSKNIKPDSTNWQNCSPFTCQECGLVFWLWYNGKLESLNMVYCGGCFEK